MTQVKPGDTVRIHYTGTLSDGATFDSSEGRDPLEFVVGSGQIIAGLDSAIPGMTVGEKKVVEVPADQAYGHSDPNALQAGLCLECGGNSLAAISEWFDLHLIRLRGQVSWARWVG